MYRNHPLYRNSGGMAHDERTIRNVDDEIYRIAPKTYDRGAVGRDARDEYGRDLREKRYLRHRMNRMANGGMPMMPPPPMGPPPMGGPPPQMGPAPEGIEAAFAQQMSQKVDSAGNTEQLIDAIRGNDKPIQARYDELSQYVGQQDAHQTPETVLALVQPTFLMTEQGVMESGIEQLLQQIPPTGDPAMGSPPPMAPPPLGPPGGPPQLAMGPPPTDQGVGALLGPGMSPPPPPPPQMMAAVGGAVKKLQGGSTSTSTAGEEFWALGGDEPEGWREWGKEKEEEEEISRLAELFGEDYQTIKEIMAPTEQQNRLARSQLFFDAARAGLNLAANRDSQGRPLYGSTASKFAAVTEPVLAGVPKASEAALSAAGEAAAKQAAIQSALARRTTEEAHKRSLEELGIQEEADLQAARIAAGASSTPPTEWTLIAPDGTTTVIDARNPTARNNALQLQSISGYTIHTGTPNIPTPDFSTSNARGVFANPDVDMWNRVELNKQTDDDIVLIQSAWEELTRRIPTGEIDVGGLPIYAPESDVGDYYQQIINRHVEQFPDSPFTKYATEGITTPGSAGSDVPSVVSGTTSVIEEEPVATSPMSFDIPGISPVMKAKLEAIIGEDTDPAQSFLDLLDDLDAGVTEVYGIGAALERFMTEKAGAIFPPFRTLDPEGAADARSALTGFTTMSALAMAEAMEGRVAQQTLDRFHNLFPEVAQVFTNPPQAIADYKFVLTTQREAMMTGARQLAEVQSKLAAGGLSREVAAELRDQENTYERALPVVALSMIKIDGIIKRLESGQADRGGESINTAPPGALPNPNDVIEDTLGGMTINPRN